MGEKTEPTPLRTKLCVAYVIIISLISIGFLAWYIKSKFSIDLFEMPMPYSPFSLKLADPLILPPMSGVHGQVVMQTATGHVMNFAKKEIVQKNMNFVIITNQIGVLGRHVQTFVAKDIKLDFGIVKEILHVILIENSGNVKAKLFVDSVSTFIFFGYIHLLVKRCAYVTITV